MTSRAIALLAFKVLALLAMLVAVGPGAKVLPTMLLNWPYDSEGGSLLLLVTSLLAPIVLPLMLGGALWFGADALARKLFAASDTAVTPPTLEALQDLAFSVVGVFILGVAIPDLTKLAYYYWQLSAPGGVQIGSDIERRGALIETVVQLVIGLWLLFGASGIANLLRKVRGR